ncbi:DVU0298 family protein [Thermodesulfobacteriota bacterium]
MNKTNRGGRKLKKRIRNLLAEEDFETALATICRLPAREVISPLFSFFYSTEELIKWRAVIATGVVVSNLAGHDMESARVVMRRLMWNLNDESGGIGWGSPEAMGEIMARHLRLAEEFASILISYIRKDGSYIEHELLQRGVLWGLGRLAQAQPQVVIGSAELLLDFLDSDDATVRGLAAWICGILDLAAAKTLLEDLKYDDAGMTLFRNGQIKIFTVSELAIEALSKVSR